MTTDRRAQSLRETVRLALAIACTVTAALALLLIAGCARGLDGSWP